MTSTTGSPQRIGWCFQFIGKKYCTRPVPPLPSIDEDLVIKLLWRTLNSDFWWRCGWETCLRVQEFPSRRHLWQNGKGTSSFTSQKSILRGRVREIIPPPKSQQFYQPGELARDLAFPALSPNEADFPVCHWLGWWSGFSFCQGRMKRMVGKKCHIIKNVDVS